MYLDRQLWAFTAGIRARIVGTVLLGLVAVSAGIARLALLGWLLGRMLAGVPLATLIGPAALVALAIGLRGASTTCAPWSPTVRPPGFRRASARWCTRTCSRWARRISRRARTGDVILSVVEGVQQLEVYFGQYLPQLFVSVLTPVLIFAFMAWVDRPIAFILLGAALLTLLAPSLWHRWDSARSLARQRAYSAFGAEFLDALQGLGTLKAFGQSAARARAAGGAEPRAVPGDHGRPRDQHAGARDHRRRHRARGGRRPRLGGHRVRSGAMPLETLLVILMLGVEVFRPLRDLRVLLHQGMLGLSAAPRGLRSPAMQGDRPRRARRGRAGSRADPHRGLRGRDLRAIRAARAAGARADCLCRAGGRARRPSSGRADRASRRWPGYCCASTTPGRPGTRRRP